MDSQTRPLTITSYANVNIALLKYWGKADETLKIPYQSSLSLTLDGLGTTTTIHLDPTLTADQLFFDGAFANEKEQIKISKYLHQVRALYHCQGFVKIDTKNDVPTAAGLASSASAYASIALGLNQIYGLNLDKKGLSKLARLGSGSAARSIYGGFALWHHGDSHDTSYAEPILSSWNDLVFVVVLISRAPKKTSSTEAMKLSVKTKEYQIFVMESQALLPRMLEAIGEQNLSKLGPLVEQSSDLLHATIRATGIDYYLPETRKVLERVKQLKAQYPLFYTIDAGPNAKLLTTRQFAKQICQDLKGYETMIVGIGADAYVRD